MKKIEDDNNDMTLFQQMSTFESKSCVASPPGPSPEKQLQASRGDFLSGDEGSRVGCGPICGDNVYAPRIMLCRKARRQSQYVEKPLKAGSDDKIEVSKSQKDQETENPKQNEPKTGERLTCCISCRYFGFRSELMMDGGNPTRGNFFNDRDEASTGVQPVGVLLN
ncbi:hypothetical protein N7536_004304 [Penicillium majusculum]|nr:hypothetical protein N7536_004304 [Penicillium majusculum]